MNFLNLKLRFIGNVVYNKSRRSSYSSWVCGIFKLTFSFSTLFSSQYYSNPSPLLSGTQNSFRLSHVDSKAYRAGKLQLTTIKAFYYYSLNFCLVRLATGRSPPFLLHQSKIKLVLTKNGKSKKSL